MRQHISVCLQISFYSISLHLIHITPHYSTLLNKTVQQFELLQMTPDDSILLHTSPYYYSIQSKGSCSTSNCLHENSNFLLQHTTEFSLQHTTTTVCNTLVCNTLQQHAIFSFSMNALLFFVLNNLIERNPPLPGGFPIYYVPSPKTVCKRTPLEGFVPGSSRGVLLHTVLDEGT